MVVLWEASDALREAVDAPDVATSHRGRQLEGVPGDWQRYAVELAGWWSKPPP